MTFKEEKKILFDIFNNRKLIILKPSSNNNFTLNIFEMINGGSGASHTCLRSTDKVELSNRILCANTERGNNNHIHGYKWPRLF